MTARARHVAAFLDRADEPAFLAPLGNALDRMVTIQMTAYPSAWTEAERREAAEEYLFGQSDVRDKSGCQYCDGYCHGGCRENEHV